MSTKSKSGFTIIEVVLVLAIAGLIFLMVFIALPNMQRSQRDTQRRNDYSALSANITQYITNNNGALPNVGAVVSANKYINETGEDPDGNTYILEVVECATSGCTTANFDTSKNIREDGTQVFIVRQGGCKGGALEYVKSNRAFAIYGQLETGEGSYCQSNS